MQIDLTMAEAEQVMRLIDTAIDRAGPGARVREAISMAPIAAKIFAAVDEEQKARQKAPAD